MTKTKAKRNKSGGRAPPRGVSLQATVAAWMAVHALAKRGVGTVFGTVETAYPDIIRHETWHGVDDVEVVLSDGGRLFLQATRQPKPGKVTDFLKQATETWLAHKTSAGGSVQRPLTRSKDALVLVVPGDARKNLRELEAALRKFDAFDRWSDVPLSGLTGPQNEELPKAKAAVVATWKRIRGAAPTDDELVELFGLLRVVRFDLDPGERDERLVLALLQDGVGLTQAVASRAWDRLCRDNIDWMQQASGRTGRGFAAI